MHCRYTYKGLGWLSWQSDQPTAGVVSPPTVATSISSNPRIGYPYGPQFYLRSFYVTPYCRNYVQFNMTGYLKVCSQHWVPFYVRSGHG